MNRNQYNYYQSIIKNGVVGDTRTLLLRVVMIMDENSLFAKSDFSSIIMTTLTSLITNLNFPFYHSKLCERCVFNISDYFGSHNKLNDF